MKIRSDFVTNSSSSSFVVSRIYSPMLEQIQSDAGIDEDWLLDQLNSDDFSIAYEITDNLADTLVNYLNGLLQQENDAEEFKEDTGYSITQVKHLLAGIKENKKEINDEAWASVESGEADSDEGFPCFSYARLKIKNGNGELDTINCRDNSESLYKWAVQNGFSDGDPDEYDPDNDQHNYSEDMFFDPPYEKMADTWDMTERKKVGNSDQLHSCAGKKFVIAGEMKHFQGRDGIVECITADGGKVTENVGKKTDYLVDNIDGYSAKREKAKKLNVPVITEDKFIEMFGGSEKVVDQKKVDIPKPITRNGIIFEEWEYNLLKDGTVRIVNYTGQHSTVKIPSMLDHKEVSEIGPDLFSLDDHDGTRRIPREKRKSLEPIRKVYIPGSVKKIGRNAFSCNPVKKVLMEDGTEEIGAYAFSGCQLESIKLPGTLTIIGKGAFEGSQGIKQWNLPEGLKVIDDDAFQYSSIYDVYIPSSVKKIADNAFIGAPFEWDEDGFPVFDEDEEGNEIDHFTIYGKPGSKAEEYAENNGFSFVPADHCPF